MFRLRSTLFLVSALIVATGSALADDNIPEYEGVYLRLAGDELVKLPRLSGRPCSAMTSDLTFDVLSGKGRMEFRYANDSEFTRIPVVSQDAVEGFYINTRDERVDRVNKLANLSDYLDGKRILTGVYRNGCGSGDISRRSAALAFGTWGWGTDQLRAKFLTDFVTFYELSSSKLATRTTVRLGGNKGDNVRALGLYVSTDRYNYPFFLLRNVSQFLKDEVERGGDLSSYQTLRDGLEKFLKNESDSGELFRNHWEVVRRFDNARTRLEPSVEDDSTTESTGTQESDAHKSEVRMDSRSLALEREELCGFDSLGAGGKLLFYRILYKTAEGRHYFWAWSTDESEYGGAVWGEWITNSMASEFQEQYSANSG